MQHRIKPFLEFSPNARLIFRVSPEYSRISFVNELRLNSGNSVETSKIHGFTGFTFIRFSANFFEMLQSKIFSLRFVGCLVVWPPVLTLNPKILGSIHKQLKKANKNINILPSNKKNYFTK
jgi:hypothetical protein